jgi:endo-1,4-beta-xylanase
LSLPTPLQVAISLVSASIVNMGVLSHLVSLSAIVAAVSAAPAPAPKSNFALSPPSQGLSRRAGVNYNQDYVAGGANVQYSPNQGAGTFTVKYSTSADFVVGLGWQPGDRK